MTIEHGKITSIQLLRGIAVLSVCLFHFTNAVPNYLPDGNILKQIFYFGSFGVQMFFVIYGFVLPYSLSKANYHIGYFFKFLLKRIIRLEPAYVASIILIIVLGYLSALSPYYRGQPFQINMLNLILHFGYLNAFFNEGWFSPVYWTLAIEFQFYIVLGLLFSFIGRHKIYFLVIMAVALLTSAFIRNNNLIFVHAPFFLVGICAYCFYTKRVDLKEFLFLEIIILFFISMNTGYIPALVASISLLGILVLHQSNSVLEYLGKISYSLYLIHIPIGMKLINLSENFIHQEWARVMLIIVDLLVCILFASIFYWVFEKKSQQISSFMQYNDVNNVVLPNRL